MAPLTARRSWAASTKGQGADFTTRVECDRAWVLDSLQMGRPIAYDSEARTVVISPERLPQSLRAHLERFRLELLNPANADLRRVFEQRFDGGFRQSKNPPHSRVAPDVQKRSRKQPEPAHRAE